MTEPSAGLHVVLVAPQIASNTGSILRLCANVGADLHLVEPLGFELSDRRLRRAGLDYEELVSLRVHRDWECCVAALPPNSRHFGFSAEATRRYDDVEFSAEPAAPVVLVFGCEATGLPDELRSDLDLLAIPLRPGNRSMNLANAAAVAVFEVWRQRDFEGSVEAQNAPHGGPVRGVAFAEALGASGPDRT